MKHASQDALNNLEDLLAAMRQHPGLKEKKRGIFYWKSNAFLHFHEDHDQLFADLRVCAEWQRFPVNTQVEQDALLAQVSIVLQESH